MDKKVYKKFPLELDKKRTFMLNFHAMRRVEEEYGLNLLSGEGFKNISSKNLTLLLWAGLIHEDEELSVETVDDLINDYGFDAITRVLSDLVDDMFPAARKKRKKKGKR